MSAGEPRHWALLIGVEDYAYVPKLQYTANDVQQLAATLATHGGYDWRCIQIMTDREAASEPNAALLKESIPAWLSRVGPDDTVIVFFSGHGFKDKDGKLYLAPLDFELSRPAETGLPIDWLRQQVAACKADFKLLILDACHAGTEKGGDQPAGVTAHELGSAFEELQRVVTLASSTANETSLIWPEKQRSLYSYWLTEGLKGHADLDSDGRVDIDELFKYVARRVEHTAQVRFEKSQTPRRIVRTGTKDIPTVVELKPQPLEDLLANMAEHIANSLQENQQKSVGVLEFVDDSQLNELLGGQFGLLGKNCAERLENHLVELGTEAGFSVVDRRVLRKALHEQGFKLQDLASPEKQASLSEAVGGMPIIAVSAFRDRRNRVIRLQCKLQKAEGNTLLAVTGGTAAISENDWAMQGHSADLQASPPEPPQSGESSEEAAIEQRDEEAAKSHPFSDKNFEFPIQFVVNGQVRQGRIEGNNYFVGVRAGEVYSLRMSNRSGRRVVVRLLVDGLDTTLRPETKQAPIAANGENGPEAVPSESDKGVVTELWAQPVTHLDDAGWRLLDPADTRLKDLDGDGRKDPTWVVRGYTTKIGKEGKIREFRVVDAQSSLAGRQGFTEQIGLITAVFYEAEERTVMTPRSAYGTEAGEERAANIRTTKAVPGRQLAIVHIRYVDADTIETAGR